MKPLTQDVCVDAEVAALAKFVSQKWEPTLPPSALEGAFSLIAREAAHLTRGWLKPCDVSDAAHALIQARTATLSLAYSGADATDLEYHDSICLFLSTLDLHAQDFAHAGQQLDGPWSYDRTVGRIARSVTEQFPALQGISPRGWEELASGYSDFDGMEDYTPKADRECFEGSEVTFTASPSFTSRVALPYVMYDEKCQGNSRLSVLVGAVFSHFTGISEFLNTAKLVQEAHLLVEQAPPTLVFGPVELASSNPFLQAVLHERTTYSSEADFMAQLKRSAELRNLSDAERQALAQANHQCVEELLASLSTKDAEADEAMKEKHAARILRFRAALGS